MWTCVGPSAEVAVLDGFAVGDEVSWRVASGDIEDHLPALPADFDGVVGSIEDADLDLFAVNDLVRLDGTVVRILMLTGRRRTTSTEITATPAEHVQVLDLAGFLVEVKPSHA
ncbi:hypothetical protein [Aeromicrobium sp.]|uniref:hypothetical protein n=1 Tax=Aeromicrobium sp. TaxID=1871063 RepID=UPI0019AD6F7F|nr:hypothetical protein [Aeromicrobium sp.]MBC7633411.1 hypothetical protein [Aeromicrobium sp.]